MISNTKKALEMSLWIAEMHPSVMPAEWGNQQMGALELAIQTDTVDMWKNLAVGLGPEFMWAASQYMALEHRYDVAVRIRDAKNEVYEADTTEDSR